MFSTRTLISRGLIAALVLVPGFVMNGCNHPMANQATQQGRNTNPNPPSQPPAGSSLLVGSASLIPGAFGDLGNSMVGVYRGLDEWYNYMPVAFVRAVGQGAQITFSFTNLVPGTYYLDVWKDVDNSARWSYGDFVGWVGNGSLGSPGLTPFQVREATTTNVGDIFMYQIVAAAQASKVGANDK